MTKTILKESSEKRATAASKRRKPAKHKNDDSQKKSRKRPLNGLVVSISTLKASDGEDALTFNSVSQTAKSLGAEVLSQVGKRCQYMIVTRSAVLQCTQRVRKAYKKRIPIVETAWLEACAREGKRVDMEKYRLDKEAEQAIQNREDRTAEISKKSSSNDVEDVSPEELPADDAGWTEAQDLGCCCVCHENNCAKDCQWCKDLDCAK